MRAALLALVAGFASASGFVPLGLWPFAILGLAAWLWLVHDASSLKAALWRSWLFGVAHFTLGNNWIQHAFDFQDRMPPVLGYFAVVGLALYLAVYPMLAGGLAWRLGRGDRPDGAFALVSAAAWIVTEWLRATMFTGYAWNPLSVMLIDLPTARWSSWIGTYALSGLVVAVAGLALADIVRHRAGGGGRLTGVLHSAVLVLVVAMVAALPVLFAPAPPTPAPNAPRVRIVQPNIGQDQLATDGYARRVLDAQMALSGRPGPVPRLVVWPEGTVNYWLEEGYPPYLYDVAPDLVRIRIAGMLGPRDTALVGGTALLTGADGRVEAAGNSVFAITPNAQLGGRYDKAHLVPYGEYLPLRSILEPLGLSRLVMGDVDFRPGPGPRALAVPGFGRVGMQICYEIIFSGQVVDPEDRPDLLFNPSNDAWFGRFGPPQHLAQARLRAIEEGLPILRATPTGISAVIGADGTLIATIPHGQAGAVEVPRPLPLPPTLFARAGNWLALAMIVLLSLAAVALRRGGR